MVAALLGLVVIDSAYYMPRDRRPEMYGIGAPMPDGWFAQLAHPFRRQPGRTIPR